MHLYLNRRPVLIVLAILWLGLVIFSIADGLQLFGLQDIGIAESLKTSQLARSIYIDYTILSILAAFWILWDGYHAKVGKTIAIPLAILTLLAGSSGLLLYLIVRVLMWRSNRWTIASGNLMHSWNPVRGKK